MDHEYSYMILFFYYGLMQLGILIFVLSLFWLIDMNNQITNVYIWDMDETLILLKSLLNGSYAEAFAGLKDAQKGVEIGKMWEKHILQISDDFFFYEQVCLEVLLFIYLFFPFYVLFLQLYMLNFMVIYIECAAD